MKIMRLIYFIALIINNIGQYKLVLQLENQKIMKDND